MAPSRAYLWVGLAVVLVVSIGVAGYHVWSAYAAADADTRALGLLAAHDSQALTPDDLGTLQSLVRRLRVDVRELNGAARLPVVGPALSALPGVGPPYAATLTVIDATENLAAAADGLLSTAVDVLPSLRVQSQHDGADAGAPTWLDLVGRHRGQLTTAMSQVRQARRLRAAVRGADVPGPFQGILARLDRVLAQPAVDALASFDVAAAEDALGANHRVRYLVLLQNPAELRPSGGFPGTAALVTFERGLLTAYEVFDIHQLTNAYVSHRTTQLPQPWPLREYLPQDGFLLHDALWWSDFPRGARQLLAMYAESGWPPIDGVVALQPALASALVELTGPFSVELSDGPRLIRADNIYTEIESEREWFAGAGSGALPHKEAVRLIAAELLRRVDQMGEGALVRALQSVSEACARRDLQIYSAAGRVQDLLDRQGCSGGLAAASDQPTLSITLTNLVSNKTSQRLESSFTLSTDRSSETHEVISLEIGLWHSGSRAEDPVFNGFQRWLVDVQLPSGGMLLTPRGLEANPDASSGGSYLAELKPGESARIALEFSMPRTNGLLVRKQAGLTPPRLVASNADCMTQAETRLIADTVVRFARLCGAPGAPTLPVLETTAHELSGGVAYGDGGLYSVQPTHRPRGNIDVPGAGASASGQVTVFGWAADPSAPVGSGVDRVEVYLDGARQGDATYGLARSDVARLFGSEALVGSGYSFPLDLATVPTGVHALQVKAYSSVTGATSTFSQSLTIDASADIRGHLDLPADGSRLAPGSLMLWGWAVDRAAPEGTGIQAVSVFLDGRAMGAATYGVDRPDVASALGAARFAPSGYRYTLDLNSVAPGPHTVLVVAVSSAGHADIKQQREIRIVP